MRSEWSSRNNMTDEDLKRKLLAIVKEVDYDIYKGNYVKETAEIDPEDVDSNIEDLIRIFKEA